MFGFMPNQSLQKSVKSMYARLLVFLRLRLAQFGLSNLYQPEQILSEALLRLECALKQGKNIYNHEAWLRTACFLCILEVRHDENKLLNIDININIDETLANTLTSHNLKVEQSEVTETYQILDQVILELQASERELLMMRFYENMSWDEIACKFANRGETISLPALRQRGSRAMRSLRKAYQDQIRLLLSDV
ncbi:MAG: sigma-70 family RNA polymerase sigma factor [Calothrix sp. C42_A2020_038]|nr:sigma-70 family RNA polymerase sigma factor [Calothrix sp. C42_A2020_038]